MKKTWKQRIGAIATAFMLALSIPVSAAADTADGNGGSEGIYYVIGGYNRNGIVKDLNENSVPGHAYCLDNKQNPPSIIRTKGGDIDEEKTPRYKRVLLSELDGYTKKVYKGTRNGVAQYYEEYDRVLTDNVKSRLLKVLMNESAIKEKAKSMTISAADLAKMKSKTAGFNEEEHNKRWKYITDSDSTIQQMIWTVIHDDSEWEFYVKDTGQTTHHADCYTFNETRFQYVSSDPLNDPLSLWNIYYKPMIDYIDNEITTDYYAEGYDAWVYMTYRDEDIGNQNMLGTPFKKMGRDTVPSNGGGGYKDDGGSGGAGGGTPISGGIVKILKVDENGDPLSGASFRITDENGVSNAAVWTSASEPFVFIATAAGEYTLTETEPPAGYFKTEDVVFTVNDDGTVSINNDPQDNPLKIENTEKTELHVRKTDITGNTELEGAHLVIYKASDINEYGEVVSDAKIIDEWVSDGTEHVIKGVLEADRVYVLRETIAPTGYAISTDTRFKIVGSGENKGKVAMQDPNGTDITDTIFEDIIIVKDDVLPDAHIPVPAVSKKLTGSDRPAEKEFTFEIRAAAETPDAPLPETTTVTVTGEGEAQFPDIVTNEIGTFYYEIAEAAGTEKGYTYDPTVYKFGVMTMINGGVSVAYNTVLTLDFENIRPLEKAEFTNNYTPVSAFVELPVAVKKIDGCVPAESDKTFTFGITADENADEDIPMPENTEVTVNGSGSTSSFGKITFTKAGVFAYKIAECDLNDTHRGYSRDEGVYTLTVTVTDEGGALRAAYEITKNGEPVNELVFTNKYQPEPVSVSVPAVVKKIDGDTHGNAAKTFSFGIRAAADSAEGAPLPAETTTTVSGSGSCTFGNITFDRAGVFAYEIFENDLTADQVGYTKDNSVYRFVVTVADIGGALTVERAALTKNGEAAANAGFVNGYKAKSVKATFPVEKKIVGDKINAAFTFRLYSFDSDAETRYITINGEGTASFPEAEYTETGVYSYSVNEIPGTDRGMIYDDTIYRVTDTVTDNNGQLEIARAITNGSTAFDSIVFVNKSLSQSSSVTGGSTGGSTTVDEGGSTDGGSTDGGKTDGGSTDGGKTDGGSTDGGSTDGGSTNGGSTDGGKTDGGSTDGGKTDGDKTDGGSTDGGKTDGGSTDGGSTDGGSNDGGKTDGGSTGGEATPEAGGGSDGGSNPGTGTAGIIGAGALAVCAAALLARKRNK